MKNQSELDKLLGQIIISDEITTRSLRKDGDADCRSDRPDMYYPIYANISTGLLSLEKTENMIEILPIRPDGSDGRWRWGKEKFKNEKLTSIIRAYLKS